MSDTKIEITKLPLSENLSFYKEHLERSEHEYQEATEAFEKCKISHEEHHKLTWELQKRQHEISELQKDLIQELRDRRKIQYLLSITGPLESDDEIFRQNPKLLDPRENEIETLKSQFEEQRHEYDEIVDNLKLNHQACVEEEERRKHRDANKIQELTRKVQRIENVFRENIKEMLQFKKDKVTESRRINEEQAVLFHELSDLKVKLREESERNDTVERNIESKIEKEIVNSENELRSVKVEKEQSELASRRKIEILQRKVETLTAK
ncbi:9106_t:CDS:2 [Acaulospora morrowiae]|uniref:9106_t:CDS:1 n=1 Tax=Acaulospora morrowiae TaxID=94023 RepID=A0A9N9H3E1_9GLOM|nr:9106_t:CDS:2 [Acaulospora morrowiae]